MSLFVLRLISGALLILAVALAVGFGVRGQAIQVLAELYPPLLAGIERVTLLGFSREMWDIVVHPMLKLPAWLYPLAGAALFQVIARRSTRGVG